MISRRASAPCPVGQITETSYPACTRVVASFQTRRSNGTGRFSTMIRTRRGFEKLPADTIVLSIQAVEIADTNKIDDELIGSNARRNVAEFRIAVSDDNDLAVRKRLIEGFHEKR